MGGFVRRMLKVDGWVWIIVLSLTLVAIYLAFIPQADAITRDEFNELKKQSDEIENNIAAADKRLDEQYKKINLHRQFINKLQQELREVSGSGWNDIQQKLDLEERISNATELMVKYRDELRELVGKKSDLIGELKAIDIDGQVIENNPLTNFAPKIGIVLSKNCITMLQNGMKTDCPSYEDIISLDSSDTNVSGGFVTDENGYFHRGPSHTALDCKFYDRDRYVIFVDPSVHCLDRVKLITIENNFNTFIDPGAMANHEKYEYVTYTVTNPRNGIIETVDVFERVSDFERIIFHDRYVDKHCDTATLNASNVTSMLADTINYMRSGCDESQTSYVTKEVIPVELTPQDPTTTQDYRDREFLKYVKEFCIFKFKAC